MSDLSDYGEGLLAAVLADRPWIKLHTGAPGEAGTADAAGETTRQQATLGAASGGVRRSTADLTWADVSTSETISHVSAWDNDTAGNCEWVAALASPRALSRGDTLKIASGDLSIALA